MLCRLDEIKMCEEEWDSTIIMYEKSAFEIMEAEK
jgi:hypothetical protein